MHTDWTDARNVLCIRLDSIGDVLMTSPALRALRDACSSRRITLLTSIAGAAAARVVPEVDETMTFRAPWMKAPGAGTRADDTALIAALAEHRFDAAVIFTVYSQNPLPAAYLCYLAGIPLRAAHCRENPYQLLTDWVPDPEPLPTPRHEVRRQLDLVAAVGCRTRRTHLSFAIPAQSRRRAARMLQTLAVDPNRPLIVAHPGASAASRRYPPEQFGEALRLLAAATGCTIVLTGDAAERELVELVRTTAACGARSLAGELDLAELGAVIAAADVLVTNNTAPAHIGAAVGTPVVDLYALTNPQHTPWQVEHRVLYHDVPCRWCYKSRCPLQHHECLRLVAPQSVAAAALDLLAGAQRPAAAGTTPRASRSFTSRTAARPFRAS